MSGSSALAPDLLAQLVPLLGSLARLIAGHGGIADEQLDLLLDAADLEAHPPALAELKRWARLLTRASEPTNAALRQTVVEALLMRGLPEASVLLAVATVAGDGSASPPAAAPIAAPSQLQTSVATLDFGMLPSGQGAALEFEVHGGPGQVVIESDQLRVTPAQFGTDPTRLRVEVRPLASGLLWTALKLVTASTSLELPVMAQWNMVSPAPAQLAPPPPLAPAPAPPPRSTAQHQNTQRLFVYILLDVSASMSGAPLRAFIAGLQQFQQEVVADPFAHEVTRFSMITFGSFVEQIIDRPVRADNLAQIWSALERQADQLEREQAATWRWKHDVTRLDLAFQQVRVAIDRDIHRPIQDGAKGDWRPIIFVVLDGLPTDQNNRPSDAWQIERRKLIDQARAHAIPGAIIVAGVGPDIDDRVLQAISTGTAFRMGTNEATFATLFRDYLPSSMNGFGDQ